MNSTLKGDNFEKKVFDILKKMLESGELLVDSKLSKIYTKKKYYSKDRKSDIIIDISIECTLPNKANPSLYIMVECKDYNKSLPIDDVEEFYSKIGQITGSNVKGIIVTSNSLQKAAFNFASSKKIGVLRILPDTSIDWMIERTSLNAKTSNANIQYMTAFSALTNEHFTHPYEAAFGLFSNTFFSGFSEMMNQIISD